MVQIGDKVRIVGLGVMEDDPCVISGGTATGYIVPENALASGMEDMLPADLSLLSSGQIGETVSVERLCNDDDASKDELFLQFCKKVENVILNERFDWEERYDRVFNKKTMATLRWFRPRFDWYDPDTSYEEDLQSFLRALKEEAGITWLSL